MRRISMLLVVAALLPVGTPARASEEVTVSQLVTDSAELAGVAVVVEGELVGDYGFRDDGSMWTQLNGDTYALVPLRESERPAGGNVGVGVRMPAELAEGLDPPGGYRNRGPVVRLTGVWAYHDVDRQGESFLRVESLEIVEPGRPLHERPNVWAMVIGLLLVGVAATVWITRPEE